MKKLTLILVLILIVTTIGGGLSSVAFAESFGIETSNVMDDLTNSNIAGEEFNPENYGYTDERSPILLAFSEYGFAFDKSAIDYNIYVYLYNPSGREIKTKRNTITVATVYENGSAVDYDKFTLKLLSVSDGKYARLFYKFKIADPTKLHTRVAANTNARRYDVSEIELNFGETTSEAFEVGNCWTYSGYAQGYGADSKADSSLACVSDSIETLKLDVKSTYYRYNNGVNKQSDLSSVYFGVPKEIRIKYGKLQQIKANWFETKTMQQVVLTDKSLYNSLYSYLGYSTKDVPVTMSDLKLSDGRSPQLLYGGEVKIHEYGYDNIERNYSFSYDGTYKESPDKLWLANTGNNHINKLTWLFYSANQKVSAAEVMHEAETYTNKFGGELLVDKYSKDLFVAEVDSEHKYGWQGNDGQGVVIDADSVFDINGFTTGSSFSDWWAKIIYKDIEMNPLENIAPIKIVEDKDVLGSASTIAERLYIEESDVTEFLSTYEQNKLEGKDTVLFRFSVTDFVTNPLYAYIDQLAWNREIEVGYVAQQTVFLDFDIIWLKFMKAGQSTVIPCVSSPIDIFHGLTPPLEPRKNLWVILIVIAVIVLLLVVLFKLAGFIMVNKKYKNYAREPKRNTKRRKRK